MRVLLISHTCQSRTEGQAKAQSLAAFDDVELKVLVPDRWRHYGHWRKAEAAADSGFDLRIGKVRWPWIGKAQFYLHWYPELRNILREFEPQIIDLWEEPWGLVSAHTCWLRDQVAPFAKIVTETEQNINKKLPFPFEQLRRYTLRRTDIAIARNRDAVAVLRDKGYQGHVDVVPNGVDTNLFRPLDRDLCRAKVGSSGFLVGYVGRLVEEKGVLDVLDALKLCHPDVRLVFVGSGSALPQLNERVGELALGNRVRFLENRPLSDLPEVMNAFDVLVLPSHTTSRWKEQFGRVIIEAHACGVPVIGTDSGAIPEVVGAGGVLVPQGDARAIAAAINDLRARPDRARDLGRVGRSQVESHYTWQRVAERMRSVYRRVLSSAAGANNEGYLKGLATDSRV